MHRDDDTVSSRFFQAGIPLKDKPHHTGGVYTAQELYGILGEIYQ